MCDSSSSSMKEAKSSPDPIAQAVDFIRFILRRNLWLHSNLEEEDHSAWRKKRGMNYCDFYIWGNITIDKFCASMNQLELHDLLKEYLSGLVSDELLDLLPDYEGAI